MKPKNHVYPQTRNLWVLIKFLMQVMHTREIIAALKERNLWSGPEGIETTLNSLAEANGRGPNSAGATAFEDEDEDDPSHGDESPFFPSHGYERPTFGVVKFRGCAGAGFTRKGRLAKSQPGGSPGGAAGIQDHLGVHLPPSGIQDSKKEI